MEFLKDGDEEHFNLCIEKQVLLLLSDDNQKVPNAWSRISKDPLYLFKIVHGSCGCTNSSCSDSRVLKRTEHAKVQLVHQVNKVVKPKNGTGTGVFIPQPGHLTKRSKLRKPRSM